MNNKEVCHIWANQNRAFGKGSNLFFDGPTIYSYGYHFPIATLKTLAWDEEKQESVMIALFNPGCYSVSTSKHQSYARRAIHSRELVYLPPSMWDAIETRADLEAAKEKYAADEEAAAARAKEEKKEAAKRRREEKKAKEAAMTSYPAELLEWKAGGNLPRYQNSMPTALRLIDGGKYIETTRGAKVPTAAARRIWPILAEAVAKEEREPSTFAWTPFFSAPDFKWGDYTGVSLHRIAMGSPIELVVGCHHIPFSEVEDIARHLYLI